MQRVHNMALTFVWSFLLQILGTFILFFVFFGFFLFVILTAQFVIDRVKGEYAGVS